MNEDNASCRKIPQATVVTAVGMDRARTMMPQRQRELPDMMSASEGEGGHGKADVVREVA